MTYLVKYTFQMKQKIVILIVFNIIIGINECKTLKDTAWIESKHREIWTKKNSVFGHFSRSESLYQAANVNVDLMEENLIQMNDGIKIYVNVSVRNVKYVKIMSWILLHVAVKMENMTKYYGWWFSDYVWSNYRVIQQRKKKFSNKFEWRESNR